MFQKLEKKGRGFVVCALVVTVLSLVMNPTAIQANAGVVFYDDFEDGDHLGWSFGGSGDGSSGVEDHSDSLMAYIYHHGEYSHWLMRDFDYTGENILSFDMHAEAIKVNGGGGWKHASCGVTVTLYDNWNAVLGIFTLKNATNSSWLVTGDIPIDGGMHHYSATMANYASQAGLDEGDLISRISLKFFVEADQWHPAYQGGWYDSHATVWVDNVSVVPEPATLTILALGSLTLLCKRK